MSRLNASLPALRPGVYDRVIRALELFLLTLFVAGLLLIGVFATWTDSAPFWIGAPLLWLCAGGGLITLLVPLRGAVSKACAAAMGVFAAYIIARAGMSEVKYLARPDLVFAITAFLAWVSVVTCFTTPKKRYVLLIALFLLVAANFGMGLYQRYVDPTANALSFKGFERNYSDAVFGGFYPNSNHLAGFMELIGFIALALAVFGRIHSFVRVLCAGVFLMAAAGTVLSTSRAGLVAMLAGLVLMGVISGVLYMVRRQGRAGGKAMLIVLASLLMVGSVGGVGWKVLERQFGNGKVTADLANLNGREQIWERAVEQWQVQPLVGTGARSFEYYERKLRSMSTPWVTWSGDQEVDALFAHNDWLQLLADYGLAGLILAVVLLLLHGGRGLGWIFSQAAGRGTRSGDEGLFSDYRGAVVLGTLCGLSAFAIHCLGDFQMHTGINAVTAACLLGFLANPGSSETERPPPGGPQPPAHFLCPPCRRIGRMDALFLSPLDAWRLALPGRQKAL